MHDFHYTRLLEDPTKFQPRTGNRYIDFTSDQNGLINVSEDCIDEGDISEWVTNSAPHNIGERLHEPHDRQVPALKFLIGSPEEHHSDAKILPLPISRTTFELIRTEWSMPTELLRMMLSTLPLALPFVTRNNYGQVLHGLIVRCARSRDWNFCLAVIHNAVEGNTLAIVTGMQEHEIEKLLTCLKLSMEHIGDPMLLPLFLLELRTNYFALFMEKRAIGIEEIEHATGMRGFTLDPRNKRIVESQGSDKLKNLDFHSITQRLTGATGTLGFCDMTFKSNLKALELVVSCRAQIEARQTMAGADRDDVTANAVDNRIDYLRELIAGAQALGDVLTARTKAQVQTVYSLIGQRDNKLNIETAAAAKEIAEISLLHNAAMTTIAEDSRDVAVLTRRDSVDMRIIAAMTLIFLPGAYIAAIFGSNMFQFIPAGSTTVVSDWVWLFWVLNVTVTLIVLIAWWHFSKRQHVAAELDKSRQKSESTFKRSSTLEKQTSDVLGAQAAALDLDRSRTRSVTSVA